MICIEKYGNYDLKCRCTKVWHSECLEKYAKKDISNLFESPTLVKFCLCCKRKSFWFSYWYVEPNTKKKKSCWDNWRKVSSQKVKFFKILHPHFEFHFSKSKVSSFLVTYNLIGVFYGLDVYIHIKIKTECIFQKPWISP